MCDSAHTERMRATHTHQIRHPLERQLTELGLCGPPETLKVLVVDSARLHGHARVLLQGVEDSVSVVGHDAAMARLSEGPFDIVLVTVAESVINIMIVASKMRAIERQQHPSHPRAAIIACTSNLSDYADCSVSGSGLSGALNAPWTRMTVHACLDRWRAGKYLRESSLTE